MTFRKICALLLLQSCLTGCAAAVLSGVATGAAIVHDRRSIGTVIDDEAIELNIVSKLLQDEQIRLNTHVNVTSYNYLVLITGEAPSLALKNKVEALVRSAAHVREVYNEINVSAASAYLARSSDTLITSKVKAGLFRLSQLPDFDPTRVKVVTENGTVYLMGLLTRDETEAVSNYTRSVGGVEKVVKIVEYMN